MASSHCTVIVHVSPATESSSGTVKENGPTGSDWPHECKQAKGSPK
jgi:hypothetical protein